MRTTQIFQFITPTIIRVTDTKTAEMIKLIDNTSRDVQFAFANEVASMCDGIGVSAMEVISSGKQGYPRTNVALPGPVGGPCLSKDSHILIQSLSEFGYHPRITSSARLINESQPFEVASLLFRERQSRNLTVKNIKVSFMGLAFKGYPETDDIRGSMAIPVIQSMKDLFNVIKMTGYDPLVKPEVIKSLGLECKQDILESFSQSDIAIILTNHKIFKTISLPLAAKKMNNNGIIYDFWNHFTPEDFSNLPNNVKYISLGSYGASIKYYLG
jgi:UDP-N-acetyl-D-mannosaminuronic acid dehydrogenase